MDSNPEPDPNIDTRSLSQWFGFADPDSDQNIMDPEPDPNIDQILEPVVQICRSGPKYHGSRAGS